jgi:hypothetical protein
VALGPAILSVGSVSSVDLTRSEAGLVLVSVVLPIQDVAKLKSRAESSGRSEFAVVILGQILSLPSSPELSQIGKNGTFQIAGGLSATDRRPAEIGEFLRSHVSNNPKIPGDL